MSVASTVDAADLSSQALETAISKADIFPAGTRLNVSIVAPQAIVSTYRVPRSNEKDMKIDAVLVARKIMQDSSGISKVRVLFYEASPDASLNKQVDVSVSDIKAFECGATSHEELLSSIDVVSRPRQEPPKPVEVKPVSATAAVPENKTVLELHCDDSDPCNRRPPGQPPLRMKMTRPSDWLSAVNVNDGPLKNDRLILLGRIQDLSKHGDVTKIVNYFAAVEQRAQEGNGQAVATGVAALRRALSTGEKAKQQSRGFLTVTTGSVQNLRASDTLMAECFFNPSPHVKKLIAMHLGKEMGDDAPRSGPLLERRYQIAAKIRLYKRLGKDTSQHEAYYRAIERLVPTAAPETIRRYVEPLETSLELPHSEIVPTGS